MSSRPPILLALALCLAAPPGAVLAQRVAGEPARAPVSGPKAAVDFRGAMDRLPAAALRFEPLNATRLEALQRSNVAQGGKRLQIAIHRNVADEATAPTPSALTWRPLDGGQAARIDVQSPGAAALRVAIDLAALPDDAELRVAGNGLGAIEAVRVGEARDQRDGEGRYWTPTSDGDTQWIELWVPGDDAVATPRIEAVSHFVASPLRPVGFAKALGDSGACHIDVACRTATLGPAFVNAKNAVARMVFSDSQGSYTCTGTLLNDSTPATQVPYFFSANHCISTQAEASTLQLFWNYETPTCGVRSSGLNTPWSGGADLLWSSGPSDALLLRLRVGGTNPLPAGTFFAGWDASTLGRGTAITAIHHPAGDSKKVSRGSTPGFSTLNTGAGVGSFARVNWAEGTTEGGSSGSGLFTLTGGQYLLRGGLFGGDASCANSGGADVSGGNQDFYSRLDQVYPNLQPWLGNGSSATGPTRDYTGAWFVPAEPGWGLTVFQPPGQVFALFFVYDSAGRASWYRLQGAWTGSDVITASLQRPTGAAWGNAFNPNSVAFTTVGTASLTFTSATAATLSFNDGTANRTVTLAKL